MENQKLKSIIESVSELTVMELVELIKAMEEQFGVSAAAMVAAAPAAGAGATEAPQEKTEFDVMLTASGDKKVNVIKVVRAHTSLGLKEAKELVDGAPSVIKEAVTKDDAEKVKKELEEAGASVEIK